MPRSTVDQFVHDPIGESPALKYTRKPLSLALTLRVNTDEHRTTRGEYRGGGGGGGGGGVIDRTACGTVRDRSLRTPTILVESMECHSLYQEIGEFGAAPSGESFKLSPMHTSPWKSTDCVRHTCHVQRLTSSSMIQLVKALR